MKILCFGDSNTWGYDPRGFFGGRFDRPWPELLAGMTDCTVSNQGQNGREIPDGPVAFPADTDLLIVMLGTNDLLHGASPEAVCVKMARFLDSLTLDRQKLLLIAPPSLQPGAWVTDPGLMERAAALSRHYQTLAQHLDIRFADAGLWQIPIAYDGVHFTQEGHRAFARELAAMIG